MNEHIERKMNYKSNNNTISSNINTYWQRKWGGGNKLHTYIHTYVDLHEHEHDYVISIFIHTYISYINEHATCSPEAATQHRFIHEDFCCGNSQFVGEWGDEERWRVPSCSYSANTLCALVRNDATHFGIPTNAPQFQMSIYNIFEFLNFIYLSIFCIY